MSEIITLKTTVLAIHPLLERVGMIDQTAAHLKGVSKRGGKDSDRYARRAYDLEATRNALAKSIKAHGIQEPLKVCPHDLVGCGHTYYVVDGRHRLAAAIAGDLEKVPCIEVPSDDAKAVIFAGTLRRPISQGARAFTAILANPEVAAAENGRPKKKLSPSESFSEATIGGDRKSSFPEKLAPVGTMSGLAEEVGVSLGLMSHAANIYRILEQRPSFRERFEPMIWAGVGLKSLLGQMKTEEREGRAPGRGDANPSLCARKRITRYAQGLLDLTGDWEAMEAEDREFTSDVLVEAYLNLPKDVQHKILTRKES